MAIGRFADLSQAQRGLAQARQSNVDPLTSLIQGFQTGQTLANLPQKIEQDALNQQLALAIQQAKLAELQKPDTFNVPGVGLVISDPTVTGGFRNVFPAPRVTTQRPINIPGVGLVVEDVESPSGFRVAVPSGEQPLPLRFTDVGGATVGLHPITGAEMSRIPKVEGKAVRETPQGLFEYEVNTPSQGKIIPGTGPIPSVKAKPLPKAISERISDATSAIDNLITLKSYIDSSAVKGISGPLAGRTFGINPLDPTVGNFEGIRGASKQVIGKYLEGGVLREADERKYEKIIPSLIMLPSVQQNQTQELYRSLKNKLNRDLQSYEKSGYDVSELRDYAGTLDAQFSQAQPRSEAPSPRGAPIRVNTREEYNALPSGRTYMDPDGKIGTKR